METEIKFDLAKALRVIEKDSDLNEMFRSKYGTDYSMCHTLINNGIGLKIDAEKYIEALFNGVILKSTKCKNYYLSLTSKVIDEVTTKKVVKDDNKTISETKSNIKKRWGINKIKEDITQFFNGKSKQIHRTGTKVQDLKKIFTRLEVKMYNERYINETLNESQLRELSGAIETFNKKVDSIINR